MGGGEREKHSGRMDLAESLANGVIELDIDNVDDVDMSFDNCLEDLEVLGVGMRYVVFVLDGVELHTIHS